MAIHILNSQSTFRHLLSLEDMSPTLFQHILSTANQFFDTTGALPVQPLLGDKTIANLFFEPSTRTRSTFELAAKRLSAQVLNLQIQDSSAQKGESLRDTIRNIMAMQCDFLVVRHATSGAADFIAQQVRPGVSVINAGDGQHAHPTQAMLDILTLQQRQLDFSTLSVAIVGDVLHSRVARSQIQALKLMGVPEIRVIGPKTLLPRDVEALGVQVFHELKQGLAGVDVIMVLRLQRERMQGTFLPEGDAYYHQFGLTEDTLLYANPEALIVHAGPMNRGVEIQSELADSPRALILDQVTNGIAIRMAVFAILAGRG